MKKAKAKKSEAQLVLDELRAIHKLIESMHQTLTLIWMRDDDSAPNPDDDDRRLL